MENKKIKKASGKESPSPSLDKKNNDANINPGVGKKISHTLRQYPKHIGKHGIDDERTLNPEE